MSGRVTSSPAVFIAGALLFAMALTGCAHPPPRPPRESASPSPLALCYTAWGDCVETHGRELDACLVRQRAACEAKHGWGKCTTDTDCGDY